MTNLFVFENLISALNILNICNVFTESSRTYYRLNIFKVQEVKINDLSYNLIVFCYLSICSIVPYHFIKFLKL